MEDLLATATIGSTFGLDGEVKVYPNNEKYDYLKKLKIVTLELPDGTRKQAEIIGYRVVGGQLLCSFSGYETPEKARFLARAILLVSRDQAYPLRKGQVYVADLIGCSLLWQGEVVASVAATMDGPQGLLLEAKTNDGKTHLIPFIPQYVSSVDTRAKTIVLAVDWIVS